MFAAPRLASPRPSSAPMAFAVSSVCTPSAASTTATTLTSASVSAWHSSDFLLRRSCFLPSLSTAMSQSVHCSRGNARRGGKSRGDGAAGKHHGGHIFASHSSAQPTDPFAGPDLLPREPASLPADSIAVLWFRNDLRVRDNAALRLANSSAVLVPLFVYDMTIFGTANKSPWGFPRCGPFRAQFMLEAVEDLSFALRKIGSELLIRQGVPCDVVLSVVRLLVEKSGMPVYVVTHKECTWEEVRQEELVRDGLENISEISGVQTGIQFVWGSTMHHPHDLPFNAAGPAVPPTFTEYRKWIEGNNGPDVREEIALPESLNPFPFELQIPKDSQPNLRADLKITGLAVGLETAFPSPLSVHDFHGGCTSADDRLEAYIWKSGCLETYKETRNLSGRRNSSSKFSPWLALGCLSPRAVYWNVKRFEEKRGGNESTDSLISELMTRDYFKWVSASAGRKLFALNGYGGEVPDRTAVWKLPPSEMRPVHRNRLRSWIAGMTGAPFVDASMRELANTGFMSNHGRQNAASFLINNLELPDWRVGAEYFESLLIDYDAASNWGNWAYLAGVGSDPRGKRMFNVIKESVDYDADGWYLTRWCPELVNVPDTLRHQPNELSEEDLDSFDVKKGETYPTPIVELPRLPMPDIVEEAMRQAVSQAANNEV